MNEAIVINAAASVEAEFFRIVTSGLGRRGAPIHRVQRLWCVSGLPNRLKDFWGMRAIDHEAVSLFIQKAGEFGSLGLKGNKVI